MGPPPKGTVVVPVALLTTYANNEHWAGIVELEHNPGLRNTIKDLLMDPRPAGAVLPMGRTSTARSRDQAPPIGSETLPVPPQCSTTRSRIMALRASRPPSLRPLSLGKRHAALQSTFP